MQVLDACVAVTAPGPVLASLSALGVEPAPAHAPVSHRVDVDGPDALDRALVALNRVAIDSVGCLAVHAGVVALGREVVGFPAASGAGKSTLVAACVQAGLAYVSDEALLLEADLRVRPYRRPLGLSEWSLAALGLPPPASGRAERPVGRRELGGPEPGPDLRLRHLLRIRRGGETRLRPLPASAGVELLLGTAFNHHRDPRQAFEVSTAAAATCDTWDLEVGAPSAAAAKVRALVEEGRHD